MEIEIGLLVVLMVGFYSVMNSIESMFARLEIRLSSIECDMEEVRKYLELDGVETPCRVATVQLAASNE